MRKIKAQNLKEKENRCSASLIVNLTVFIHFRDDFLQSRLLHPQAHHGEDLAHGLGLHHAVLAEAVEALHQHWEENKLDVDVLPLSSKQLIKIRTK